jgi:hypothetical protein
LLDISIFISAGVVEPLGKKLKAISVSVIPKIVPTMQFAFYRPMSFKKTNCGRIRRTGGRGGEGVGSTG